MSPLSFDYFGPSRSHHEATPTSCCSPIASFIRLADMFSVIAAEFTAEGTANILVNQYISLWGCPRTILSDNGLQFCSMLSQAVYQLLGVHKLATSSYHPNCIGGIERVNHTMAQILDMVVNE